MTGVIVHNGKGKWTLEFTILLYTLLSIIKIIEFRSDFLAFAIMWLAISSLTFRVIGTIGLCLRFKVFKYFYHIGREIGQLFLDVHLKKKKIIHR